MAGGGFRPRAASRPREQGRPSNCKPDGFGALAISACTYRSDLSRFARLNQSAQVSRVNVCKVELDPVVVRFAVLDDSSV